MKTKDEIKSEYLEDFTKVKSALLDIIQNNRNISQDIVQELTNQDFSSIEEYNMLTESILKASKSITELYETLPKIIGNIDKEVKEQKKKLNLDDLLEE
jgi:hypothetical protein